MHQNLRNEQFARRILQLLFTADESFAPEYVSIGERWKRIGAEDIERLSRWWPKQINVSLERRTPFESAVAISMGGASGGHNSLILWVATDYFRDQENVHRFLELTIALYETLASDYGYVHPTKDELAMSTVDDPRYGKTIVPINLEKGLPAVYWGNFFGPAYVSLIGKRTLLQLSGYQKIELADGGLLVLTTRTPLALDHAMQDQVKNEIGKEFFYERGKDSRGGVPEKQ
jgi:hypothetical protein